MNVVLFQPEIPQNTGNIVRTCAVTGSKLFLVKPLGFSTSDRQLKRAGLDYWNLTDVEYIDAFETFLESLTNPFYFYSSRASNSYSELSYQKGDFLIFGSETTGLPDTYHKKWSEKFYTIPQKKETRCLNLANAVSIVLYEAWRQQGFVFS